MDALVLARALPATIATIAITATTAITAGCSGPADDRGPVSIEFRDGPCRDAPADGAGGSGGADRAAGAGPRRPVTVAPRHVLAFQGAELVVVDGATATVLASVPATDGALVRDVVFDAPRMRALVFESDADDQSGEVATHALAPAGADAPPALGAREHLGWIDGRARLAVTPAQALLFEHAYGTRWRGVPGAGPPASSLIAPRPASAWASGEAPARVHALVYGTPASPNDPAPLQLASAPALGSVLGPLDLQSTQLVAATDPPTARAIDAPALGGVVIVDVIDEVPAVRLFRDGAPGEAEPLLEAGSVARIEAAVALDGGRTLAVLTSGPARVLVARLSQDGGVLSEARVDLAGEARVEQSFFSRDLVALGDERLLAASSAGVTALEVSVSGGVSLDVDAAFAGSGLRGPLAAIDAPAP